MPYYHVRIWQKEPTSAGVEASLDLTTEELESRFLTPYHKGWPITISGKTITMDNLDRIMITMSEQGSEHLHTIIKQSRSKSRVRPAWPVTDNIIAAEGKDVTDKFISGPPGMGPPADSVVRKNTVREAYTSMKIFISHSSFDVEFAKLLIDLMRKSLNLRSTDIRCSSVDGYRLPGGVPTDQSLRAEVHDAELVIGLITPNSLKSIYVSFELGARWGADRPMIPLLASGATSEHLGGPLAGINALDCSNESQVNQLVEDASVHLRVDLDQPSSYVDEVKGLVQKSSESAVAEEQESTIAETPQLSEEASSLLIEAAKRSGSILNATSRDDSRRSIAKKEKALEELLERDLIKDDSGLGTVFGLTDEGFEVADSLRGL